MNVRFFGGYKSEYVSIPKHNPIGLYFCADSRELFLGDKLLSDGLRVVPTYADLPSISEHKVAEGVIYFVENTKNGYVLPRGGHDWLQVIYAPTSGEGSEIDLSDYYTKAEVDEAILKAIANIEINIDLSGYATEEFVISKIAEAELADQDVDLSAYYTKSETEAAIKSAVDAVEIPNVSGFATKEELEAVQAVAGSNSVKLFAVDEELFDIKQQLENIPTTYATKEDVAAIETKIPSIEGLATKQELEEAISSIEHPAIDLEGYATEDWVNAQGFLKEHQDLSEYAKKSDIPEAELFIVDFAAPDFTAALEAYKNGKLLLLANAAPDVNGYAVMNYVRDDMITFTKFLMSRSSTYGAFNTYYLHSDNTWELAKEVKLNKVEASVDDAGVTTLNIGKDTYKLDYVTNNYIVENYTTTEQLEATYVTNEKVTEVVTQEVETVITEQIETKVETVIQEKVDNGEITVQSDSISYDTW
jgi:hypothetical protein